MDRLKRLFDSSPVYAPVDTDPEEADQNDELPEAHRDESEPPFSWLEYSIFLLLGVAMLWAWNMFLAAAPYFQKRFEDDTWILNHFQAAEISVSTVTNMTSMFILSKLQKNASYPKRIASALIIYSLCFTVLALSTFIQISARAYFGFLLIAVFFTSLSTGLIQNGLFAFASGFGRGEYTQGVMTGQAVAGVLPPLAQILSVSIVPKQKDEADVKAQSSKSAFIYFITATVVSVVALLAFFYLLRRKAHTEALKSAKQSTVRGASEGDMLASSLHDGAAPERQSVGLWTLFQKLRFLASATFVCFGVTMIGFPVFTAAIVSNSGIENAIFIPTAFLLWNTGDLLGRLVTLSPKVSLTHYPFALFCISMARLVFIPMYFLCNVKGRGAVVPNDLFYLIIVQFLYGLSNGYVGSECMMGAGDWVEADEREAAGAFMGLSLVTGMTSGSLLSFLLGDV